MEAGVANGDGLALARIAGDDRPVMGNDDFTGYGRCAADTDFFPQDLRWPPRAAELVLQPVGSLAEAFDEQILGIGTAVGHAPSHVLVVAKVQGAGNAGHRIADDGKVRADEVDLVIDGRGVEGAVRVAGHQRQARIGVRAGDGPRIGARIGFAAAEGREAVKGISLVLGAGGHGEQVALGIAFDYLREIFRADNLGETGAPELGLKGAEQAVSHLVHGEAVPAFPRLGVLVEELVFDGQGRCRRQKGVDARGVCVEHGAGLGAGRFVLMGIAFLLRCWFRLFCTANAFAATCIPVDLSPSVKNRKPHVAEETERSVQGEVDTGPAISLGNYSTLARVHLLDKIQKRGLSIFISDYGP